MFRQNYFCLTQKRCFINFIVVVIINLGADMNIEFHYYLTKYLALKAGFTPDEAEIVAYSSQYVDDNSLIYDIQAEDENYQNYISQTMNIFKPKKKLMRIYILFHFLPGEPTAASSSRKDGKMHVLNTTQASTHATEIFYDTTRSDNLYSLGIASHMLSDTYSHQNFIGTFDEMNAMKGLWQKLSPNIGHADAGYKPDIPNLIWEDPRIVREYSMIDNKKRVLQAAHKLYRNYLLITAEPNNWTKLKDEIDKIIGESIEEKDLKKYPKQKENRIKKLKSLLSNYDDDNDYDEFKWFKDTVQEDVKFLKDKKFPFDPVKDKFTFKENYKKSHWFKFQEAVKDYQRIASNMLRPILDQMEIKEW